MTITIKSETVNGYHIDITQDKFTPAYRVSAYERRGGQWVRVNSHSYGDIKKAAARFNTLRRKAADMSL